MTNFYIHNQLTGEILCYRNITEAEASHLKSAIIFGGGIGVWTETEEERAERLAFEAELDDPQE